MIGPSRPAAQPSRVLIYQLFVRVFGNPNQTNAFAGDLTVNGSGKFASIGREAIDYITSLGVTHVWLTGVIRHASLTPYPMIGFAADDPDVVKGKAGSPYAITDYYDVDPDLAVEPSERTDEFTALVSRLHAAGLKVLIDFVPNHVSRAYRGVVSPDLDFGREDDKTKFFAPTNDFYYLVDPPGQSLSIEAPPGWSPPGLDGRFPPEDGSTPANVPRATGNNQTGVRLGPGDWYETVKLNYGFNFAETDTEKHTAYDPHPSLWAKVDAVLAYWQSKGVDGFRCDFAHFVPVEFWAYAIARARNRSPGAYFLAEAYGNDDGSPQPGSAPGTSPNTLVGAGGFDSVYDHHAFGVSRRVASGLQGANDFDLVRADETLVDRYARYAENHDERRAASPVFEGAGPGDTGYGSGAAGFAATAALALSSGAPLLVYAGQELGEAGAGVKGYGGEDGRTTIFDYWSPPTLRALANADYNVDALDPEASALVARYRELLRLARDPVFGPGAGYCGLNEHHRDDPAFGQRGRYAYTFLRYLRGERAFVTVVNLSARERLTFTLRLPRRALAEAGFAGGHPPRLTRVTAQASGDPISLEADGEGGAGVAVDVGPNDLVVFALSNAATT